MLAVEREALELVARDLEDLAGLQVAIEAEPGSHPAQHGFRKVTERLDVFREPARAGREHGLQIAEVAQQLVVGELAHRGGDEAIDGRGLDPVRDSLEPRQPIRQLQTRAVHAFAGARDGGRGARVLLAVLLPPLLPVLLPLLHSASATTPGRTGPAMTCRLSPS